jgi:hypothetical protein
VGAGLDPGTLGVGIVGKRVAGGATMEETPSFDAATDFLGDSFFCGAGTPSVEGRSERFSSVIFI